MIPKARTRPKTADYPLSRSLTDAFIADLESVVSTDPQVSAPYLKASFLAKFTETDKASANVRQRKAIDKWLTTERNNQLTNERLSRWGDSTVDILPGVTVKRFLDRVRLNVSHILFVPPSLNPLNGGFSGGASTSKGRRESHPALKFLDKADVTRLAWPTFRDIIRGTRWASHIGDSGLDPRFVVGNVMFTVPKNSEIDRVACKEPDMNMFAQKLFGNQIRFLLRRRAGINLNDQSVNGELARVGSISGALATLDLASASDSVTRELVERCLPPEWFYYMNLFRSHVTLIEGEVHHNHMFSSMGNGFTFELESLLFYAIARAVSYFTGSRGRISVYGDDIIAPTQMYDSLVSALCFLGFSVNPDKSFHDGPFRESCGKHWHCGLEVTPFYLRGPFRTVSDLILTLNQLTSWSSRDGGVVDPRYEAIILKYREHVSVDLWGGQDLTSRTSLVTGDRPRKRLVNVVETVPHDHIGGLLFWMFIAEPREGPGNGWIVTDGSDVRAFARLRKNLQVDTDLPVFLSRYSVKSQGTPQS